MLERTVYDVVVVGGGPSGATAAHDLARVGRNVVMLDRAGRIKPCGGAIPPRAIRDFEIPDELVVAKINCAMIVSPKDRRVDMPVDGSYVGMVDRDVFDATAPVNPAPSGAPAPMSVSNAMPMVWRLSSIKTPKALRNESAPAW